MAQTVVDVVVKVVGDQKLKQLGTSLKGTAANAVKADNKLDGFSNAADRAGKSSAKASSGVSKLSAGLGKLAAAIGAAEVARRVLSMGLDSIGSSTRLAALTSQYGEFESAQRRVLAIQNKFNLTQVEATQQFATAYARLKPLGFTLDEITDAYEGISTATKTAALDAGAANALFTQTAQALGSGVVQAEELNTIIDQAPTIVVALADELGVAAGEVKKLASDGKVSSQALLNALVKVKKDGVDLLATSLDTPGEKIKLFQRVTEQVVNALVTGVIADLAEAIKDIGLAIKDLTPVFQGLGTIAQVVMRPIIGLFRLGAEVAAGFGRVVGNISEGNWKALLEPDTKGLTNVKEIIDDIFAPLDGNLPNIPQGNLPSPTRTTRTTTQSGGASGSASGGAGRESQVPQLQRELELAKQLEPLYGKIAEARLRGDEETVTRLQGEQALLELKKQEADILASNVPPAEKLLELEKLGYEVRKQVLDTTYDLKELEQQRKEALEGVLRPIEDELELLQAKLNGNEKEIKQLQEIEKLAKSIAQARGVSAPSAEDTNTASGLVKQRDALKEQVEEAAKLKQMYSSLASGIAGEFTSAFKSIIDGSESVNEAFADMLQGIADQFLNMAMKILQDAITQQLIKLFASLFSPGAGPGAGAGGLGTAPVSAAVGAGWPGNRNYAGGGYTGNAPRTGGVDGQGGFPAILHPQETVVDHSMGQSKAMLSQYSPGNSSMGAGGPMNVNMNYTGPTMQFDDSRYVPVAAIPTIIKDAAKQGEARAMNTLKNSRGQRSRLGI